ncbi:MAG: hypothetical protein JNM70_04895 [Anaerolineae bacterium]|nr:hypothetical protein [Anaerolineae bacterium]
MAVNLQDVVHLAEGLSDDDKAELVLGLLDRIKSRDLTPRERLAVFDSMTVDRHSCSRWMLLRSTRSSRRYRDRSGH